MNSLAWKQCCRLQYIIFRDIICFSSERQDTAFVPYIYFLNLSLYMAVAPFG